MNRPKGEDTGDASARPPSPESAGLPPSAGGHFDEPPGNLFEPRYLSELEQLLRAEAALRRQGTELLDDLEYRALREQFIEGGISLSELSDRIDTLAMTRGDGPDEDGDGD